MSLRRHSQLQSSKQANQKMGKLGREDRKGLWSKSGGSQKPEEERGCNETLISRVRVTRRLTRMDSKLAPGSVQESSTVNNDVSTPWKRECVMRGSSGFT